MNARCIIWCFYFIVNLCNRIHNINVCKELVVVLEYYYKIEG